jgi:glycosyltransferase involved in cell wall biosynthesis
VDTTAWLLLANQLRAMRRRGWDVTVACTDGPSLRRLESEGITVHPVHISRTIAPVTNLLAVLRLYRLMRERTFDVVHVHTPVASLVGRLAARMARVPLILYTAHGFYFHEHMDSRIRALHIRLERLFGRITDFLFTQSSEDAATAIAERIMPAAKVDAIGNGVVIADFAGAPYEVVGAWRQRLDLPEGSVVIGTIGRLVEEKGYREFFQAAGKVAASQPSARFLIVGGAITGDRDPFSTTVEQIIASDSNLLGRVRFAGYSEDIAALMQLIDVFVLASYREGMPRSIIEAMASGKPVVATDIRGCREEVVDGVTGYLVPVRDASMLANRIEALVEDASLRREQGLAGRARAERLFDEATVIERQLGRIDMLLEERGIVAGRVG